MNAKLDVVATVREAYKGAWQHFGEMLRLIWLPGLLYLVLSVASAFVDRGEQLFVAVLIDFISLFLWPIIAVAWHRFILLGDAPAGRFNLSFGRREARFLLFSIFLVLLFMPGGILMVIAVSMPQTMTTSLLSFFGLLFLFVSLYFFVRLSLLLPAVSVDDPVNPRLVLERTRGNFWRLAAVLVLAVLPVLVVAGLLGGLVTQGPAAAIAALIAIALVSIFFAVVNVAVLSIAYRELVGPPGTQAPDSGDEDF
ncbi:hypothetical protein Plav_3496 [Parvibaculum lavamentivorans DS-1]|uniref:Transmembrane protein n=1 Tax=Parvibaculum lavamentivorans (strain DS-1 / DSM 13023 / NCIMB 13966) TaxID=402881 RepID=A7HYW2_PARL1|nr:hypothetical protein [Parvibaculum lavamentivorans]ABS65095.1 hypothetical protein Plav_3496 [Parvibaculum lavamentivorans DS-1]